MNTTSLISNCISKYTTILYYDSFRRNRRISYNLCARQRASKLKYTKQAIYVRFSLMLKKLLITNSKIILNSKETD